MKTILSLFFVFSISYSYADHRRSQFDKVRSALFTFMTVEGKATDASLGIFKQALKAAVWEEGNNPNDYQDDTYLPGMQYGIPQFAIASWQQIPATEKLYKIEKCLALNGQPERECLRIHWNLNLASPLYNSWVASHAYVQFTARALALNEMTKRSFSAQDKAEFLALIENFVEVNQWGHLVAMRHWQELVESWQVRFNKMPSLRSNLPPRFYNFILNQEIDVLMAHLGRPAEHDYYVIPYESAWTTRQYSGYERDAYAFAEVAKFNEASPTELYPLWTDTTDQSVERFLEAVSLKFLGTNSGPLYLNSDVYRLNPKFKFPAAAILNAFNAALAAEQGRRQ